MAPGLARDRPSPYGEGSRSSAQKTSRHRSAGACPPRSLHGEGQALAVPCVWLSAHPLCRSGSPDPDPFGIWRSRTTEVGPINVARGPVPRERCMARDRPSPYGAVRLFLALREERWQFPNQPHRLLTNMHHLPNQPHNILRIRNIRFRDKPTPIRIRFDAIPVNQPF